MELISRQEAINAVVKQYRYESDRMSALQEVPVINTSEQIEAMQGHNVALVEKLGDLEEFVTNTKAVYQRKAIRLEKNERDARAILKDEPDREDVKEELANILKLSDRYSALLDFIDEIQKRIY